MRTFARPRCRRLGKIDEFQVFGGIAIGIRMDGERIRHSSTQNFRIARHYQPASLFR